MQFWIIFYYKRYHYYYYIIISILDCDLIFNLCMSYCQKWRELENLFCRSPYERVINFVNTV